MFSRVPHRPTLIWVKSIQGLFMCCLQNVRKCFPPNYKILALSLLIYRYYKNYCKDFRVVDQMACKVFLCYFEYWPIEMMRNDDWLWMQAMSWIVLMFCIHSNWWTWKSEWYVNDNYDSQQSVEQQQIQFDINYTILIGECCDDGKMVGAFSYSRKW